MKIGGMEIEKITVTRDVADGRRTIPQDIVVISGDRVFAKDGLTVTIDYVMPEPTRIGELPFNRGREEQNHDG